MFVPVKMNEMRPATVLAVKRHILVTRVVLWGQRGFGKEEGSVLRLRELEILMVPIYDNFLP